MCDTVHADPTIESNKMTAPSEDRFTLSGCDAEFGSRAKNIFAGLESLEAHHVAVESTETARRESHALMKPDPSDDLPPGSSSDCKPAEFQVPVMSPPKRIRAPSRPGHATGPSKWKRYDLSDVSASQLSEQSNQKAAQDFLDGVKGRQDEASRPDLDMETDASRHVFRKPEKKPATSKDGGKQKIPHLEILEDSEDIDKEEDTTRTQVLSFTEEEPLTEAKKSADGKVKFRKRSAGRQVRSQVTNDDDEDDDDGGENLDDNTRKELLETVPKAVDSDSDADSFSELHEAKSDSEPEDGSFDIPASSSDAKDGVELDSTD